jgi:hypothetical protein
VTLALGIVGTLVALAGLVFTALERRDRRREDASERAERIEQFDLLRRQVEASERQAELDAVAHKAVRSAEVRIRRGGRDGLGWRFDRVNAVAGSATNVRVWLVRADQSDDHAAAGVTVDLSGPLLPGENTGDRNLYMPIAEETIRARTPLAAVVAWTDTAPRLRRDTYPVNL